MASPARGRVDDAKALHAQMTFHRGDRIATVNGGHAVEPGVENVDVVFQPRFGGIGNAYSNDVSASYANPSLSGEAARAGEERALAVLDLGALTSNARR